MAKSSRNKTIDFSEREGAAYLSRCISVDVPVLPGDITDKTICGDTFRVLPFLPRACADLIIADPPYNLQKRYGDTNFCRQSQEAYRAYTERWLALTLPLLKPHGSLYLCCDWKSSIPIAAVLSAFEADGALVIRNCITWEREKGRGAQANWKNSREDIWFCTAGDDYTFNVDAVKVRRKVVAPYRQDGVPKDWQTTAAGKFRDTCPSNFWSDISVPFWSMAENTAHPAQKSEKLLAKLLLASSNAGDMVFDPFLGSGSTSVVAAKLGRHWCGIEREKRYCAWAEYRLQRARTDKTIQGFADGIFYERNAKN
ncbi:MAG: site-specific DNA-methyltransferase [Treponemataceae bacterium]|nr:site-specific DNA-methyltransferase [Treponemataceae bacterium]